MNRIMEHLFIGNAEEAQNEELLRSCQISGVVNCSNVEPRWKLYHKLQIEFIWVPFDDGASFGEERHQSLLTAFRFIAMHTEQKKNVLIHCHAGISRSSAFTMSYLYWSGTHKPFEAAFDTVKKAHPVALPHYLVLESFKKMLGLSFDREAYTAFWEVEIEKLRREGHVQ